MTRSPTFPPPRILRPRREPPVRPQPAPVRALRQAYGILALRGQKLSVRRRQGIARKGAPRHGVGGARLGKAWPAVSFWPTNPDAELSRRCDRGQAVRGDRQKADQS